MEEIIQYLQQCAQTIDGVPMVSLAIALESVRTAGAQNLLASLDGMMADLHKSIEGIGTLQDPE